LIKEINLIIDVSGFNIGKKWSVEIQESYLNNIRLAQKFKATDAITKVRVIKHK
jgi:hypothetical protein